MRPHLSGAIAAMLTALVVLPLAASLVAADASPTPLAPDEAREVLRAARRAQAEPGSYRREVVRKRDAETTTTTTLIKRAAGAPVLMRIERVTVSDTTPAQRRVQLTVTNSEGQWQVRGNKAVLMPAAFDAVKLVQMAEDEDTLAPAGPARPPAPSAVQEKARTLAAHTHVAGERFTHNGAERVRITQEFDDVAQKVLKDLVEQQVDAIKKQLPFAKRMLVSAALSVGGGFNNMLPARTVYTIDPAMNRILSSERYAASGKRLGGDSMPGRTVRIADLPEDTFAVPAGVEVIRPKSFLEAMELLEKLNAEDKKQARG